MASKTVKQQLTNLVAETVEKNRLNLASIIMTIVFCGRQNIVLHKCLLVLKKKIGLTF